jgi:hypothetical protein
METDPYIIVPEHISMISWENDKIEIPYRPISSSEFISQMPDLNQDIKLEALEIDTNTLKKISQFLRINAKPPEIPSKVALDTKIFEKDDPYGKFFGELGGEELLLLILAANKLDIKILQNMCSAYIAEGAQAISETDARENLTIDELTIDEEDYIRYSMIKWHKI